MAPIDHFGPILSIFDSTNHHQYSDIHCRYSVIYYHYTCKSLSVMIKYGIFLLQLDEILSALHHGPPHM